MNLYFENSIATLKDTKYLISLYSLINCPKAGCDLALDIIIIKFKEGSNGSFKEVYRIAGRDHDQFWKKDSFKYVANSDRIYVN